MRPLRTLVSAVAVAVAVACGGASDRTGGGEDAPSGGGILGPAERARTNVDELNRQQTERDQQTEPAYP